MEYWAIVIIIILGLILWELGNISHKLKNIDDSLSEIEVNARKEKPHPY